MDRQKRPANSNICHWRSCWKRKKQWACPERWCAAGGHYGLCWWLSEEPQQEPGAHGPSWAKAKSDATALRRWHPPWSTTSQGNKSCFGTQGYCLHPSCANMGIMETNYQLEGSRRRWQGAFSIMCDSLGMSTPHSLWLQPCKEHLIPALFASCDQDSCQADQGSYSCPPHIHCVNHPWQCKASPRPGDTALATIEGTDELHGWLVFIQEIFLTALTLLHSFWRKHMALWADVKSPNFLPFFEVFFVKIKKAG